MSNGIRLNLVLDDEVRRDIIAFIREQARPLIRQHARPRPGRPDFYAAAATSCKPETP